MSVDALCGHNLEEAAVAVLVAQRDDAEDARAVAQPVARRHVGSDADHDAVRDLGEAKLSLLAVQLDEQKQLAAIERLIGGSL